MKTDRRSWYEFKAAADDDEALLYIYDSIGWDGDWGEVTAKAFVKELNAVTAPRIALHINSPGGSVFNAMAIYNALRQHSATVTSHIDGAALSAASVVALAGDEVVMAKNALFMIHDPAGIVAGTAEDMLKMATVLEKSKDTILDVYAEHSDWSREDIAAAMTEETWFTADEALEAGFVDQVGDEVQVAASFDLKAFGYRHAPALQNAGTETHTGKPAEGEPSPSAEDTAKPEGRPLVPGYLHKDHPKEAS